MKEDELHRWIVMWLDEALPRGSMFHHSPNEGKRHVSYKLKLKTMGTRSGWPDLELFVPRHAWRDPLQQGAIMLEIKRPKGGRVSENQKEIMERLRDAGAYCFVVKRIGHVKSLLEAMVKLRDTSKMQQIQKMCETGGG